MFLKRFSRPKWQHPDPEIRRQALAGLDANDPALAEIASTDAESAIRSAAVCACAQLTTVAQIWRSDADAGVRNTALRRLGLLLVNKSNDAAETATRLALLAEVEDGEILAQVGRKARNVELRQAAQARITDQTQLARIAAEDDNADLRLAALQRIEAADLLHDLARRWRGRDKRLHRLAKTLAEQIEEKQQRPIRQEATCAAMEALSQGQATLSHDGIKCLNDEWQKLAEDAPAALTARFVQARDKAAELLGVQQLARQRKQHLGEICRSLQAQIEFHQERQSLDSEHLTSLDDDLHRIKQEWRDTGGDDGSHADLHEEYCQRLHQLIEIRERLLQNFRRGEACSQHLQQAQPLLDDAHLSVTRAAQWLEQFEHLPLPADAAMAGELRARGKELGQRLKTRAEALKSVRQAAVKAVFEQLQELDELLAQGQLQPATNLFNKVRRALDELGPLAGDKQKRVDRHLQHANQRIRELRGWRRWSSNHVRDELIEQAKALVDSELPPRALAERIRSLRAEWQKLDKADSATNEPLWDQFNALCTQAYEPCKAYFEQLGDERQAQIETRRQQCAALEALYDATDWDRPDWRDIDRQLAQARAVWRANADIRGKERRLLEERYHAALDRFDAVLGPERERNLAQRREWIEQAAQLVEAEDLRSAISQAKQLQQNWTVTVAARRRRDDQKLWHSFRAHLDAVFARRDSEISEEKQQRESVAAALEQLCADIEQQAGQETVDDAALRLALREAHSRRKPLQGLPRNRERQLEQRYAQALASLQQRIEHLQQVGALAQLDACAAHAECCARLEENALTGIEDWDQRLAEFDNQRTALAPIDTAAAEILERRREGARSLNPQDDATRQRLDETLAQIEALTLRLEILAGVDSPAEYQRERLALQVDRLSAAMTDAEAGRGDPSQQASELLREWYLLGPIAAQERVKLRPRIELIRATLDP